MTYPWILSYLGAGAIFIGICLVGLALLRPRRELPPEPKRDRPRLRLVPPLPEPPVVIDATAWRKAR